MKKILHTAFLAAAVLLTACDKDEIQNTNMVDLAGQWYVTCEAVDENGELLYTDDELYGMGHFYVFTYNTAADKDEIYVDDQGQFWEFKVRAKANVAAKTFAVEDGQNEYYDCGVTIEDGKILFGAATTPHGTPADSISFYVTFDDDECVADGLWAKYHISGFRYTGLAQDD